MPRITLDLFKKRSNFELPPFQHLSKGAIAVEQNSGNSFSGVGRSRSR